MPLSPMYPPRDRSREVCTPPDEFKSAIFLGALWFGWGALSAALSGSLSKAGPCWVLAAVFWLNAVFIKQGLTKTTRVSIVLGLFALVEATWWLITR